MRRVLSLLSQVCATSESGTGFVAIFKPASTAALSSAPIAPTKRYFAMLPIPLPINANAEKRSTALGNVMFAPLTEPTWTNWIAAAIVKEPPATWKKRGMGKAKWSAAACPAGASRVKLRPRAAALDPPDRRGGCRGGVTKD